MIRKIRKGDRTGGVEGKGRESFFRLSMAVENPRCHGSQVSMDVARGSASLLSGHGRGIEPQDASKKNSRGLSRGVAGNPGFPRLVPITSGSLAGFL